MLWFLASEMRGDRTGDYGPWAGVVGFIAIALFLYVIGGGPTSRGGGKK